MPRSFLYSTLYICILLDFLVCLSIFNMVLSLVSVSVYNMFWSCGADGFLWLRWWCFPPHLESFLSYLGSLFPADDLASSGAVCIGAATNNIVEYRVVIGLLTKATSQDVRNLVVLMDSQLVVFHLKHIYTIINHVVLRLFRRVHFLKRSFETITYRHIPREHNVITESLVNYILDWHIVHSWHENQTCFIVNKL